MIVDKANIKMQFLKISQSNFDSINYRLQTAHTHKKTTNTSGICEKYHWN